MWQYRDLATPCVFSTQDCGTRYRSSMWSNSCDHLYIRLNQFETLQVYTRLQSQVVTTLRSTTSRLTRDGAVSRRALKPVQCKAQILATNVLNEAVSSIENTRIQHVPAVWSQSRLRERNRTAWPEVSDSELARSRVDVLDFKRSQIDVSSALLHELAKSSAVVWVGRDNGSKTR
jgi:hypothetical protein